MDRVDVAPEMEKIGRMGHTGLLGPFSPLFHFRCDIHPIHNVPCEDIGCPTGNGIMQCSPVQPIQPIFHFLCDILCPHMVFTLLYFLVIPIGSSLFRPLRFLLALLILPAVSFGSGRRERERRHRHCTGHLPVSLRIDRAKTYLFASVTPYNKLTNCLIP